MVTRQVSLTVVQSTVPLVMHNFGPVHDSQIYTYLYIAMATSENALSCMGKNTHLHGYMQPPPVSLRLPQIQSMTRAWSSPPPQMNPTLGIMIENTVLTWWALP